MPPLPPPPALELLLEATTPFVSFVPATRNAPSLQCITGLALWKNSEISQVMLYWSSNVSLRSDWHDTLLVCAPPTGPLSLKKNYVLHKRKEGGATECRGAVREVKGAKLYNATCDARPL